MTDEPKQNQSDELEKAEDRLRRHLTEFGRWWSKVWEGSNVGKVGILLVLLAAVTPFVVGVITVFVAWIYVWPLASEVAEKIAVLTFVFVVLTAIGLQIRGVAYQIVTGLFYTRKERKAARRGRK